MKVMISYPPLPGHRGTPLLAQNRQFQWFHHHTVIYPLVMASAATLLKMEKIEVFWNDAIALKWPYQRFVYFFKEVQPDLLVMETKTPVVKMHWQIIQELKSIQPSAKFVLLGDHVTSRPEESLRKSPVDYVITGGDYDIALLQLVRFIKGETEFPSGVWRREGDKIRPAAPFQLCSDLDSLPFIDRDLTQWYLYGEKIYKRFPFTYTMAGRDCPWARCSFCAWTLLYPEFRVRSPENLLDEIGILIERYGLREIFDDTGTFPQGEWLKRFCQGMREREYHKKIFFSANFRFDYLKGDVPFMMKGAGFRLLKLGLESANQETLDRLKKGIRLADIVSGIELAKKAGLETHLTVMVGYPWENRSELEETYHLAAGFMKRGLVDTLQATIIIPYPGTPLYQEAQENNWWRIDPADYERYDMREPVLRTGDLTPRETVDLCRRFYRIFFDPMVIFHYLASIKSIDDIRYLWCGLWAVLGHLRDFLKRN